MPRTRIFIIRRFDSMRMIGFSWTRILFRHNADLDIQYAQRNSAYSFRFFFGSGAQNIKNHFLLCIHWMRTGILNVTYTLDAFSWHSSVYRADTSNFVHAIRCDLSVIVFHHWINIIFLFLLSSVYHSWKWNQMLWWNWMFKYYSRMVSLNSSSF